MPLSILSKDCVQFDCQVYAVAVFFYQLEWSLLMLAAVESKLWVTIESFFVRILLGKDVWKVRMVVVNFNFISVAFF